MKINEDYRLFVINIREKLDGKITSLASVDCARAADQIKKSATNKVNLNLSGLLSPIHPILIFSVKKY